MSFPPAHHDHAACIAGALDAAEHQCARRGARLTSVRRRVLELVWAGHRPVTAYALLDLLRQDGYSAAPPTVYRALDFLLAQGLVHRIERLDAYIGCDRPQRTHTGTFLLCSGCGLAAEIDDTAVDQAVADAARSHGFSIHRLTVEAEGLCSSCASQG